MEPRPSMEPRPNSALRWCAFAAFLAAYGFAVFAILVYRKLPPIYFGGACVVCIGGLFLLHRMLARRPRGLERAYPYVLGALLLGMLITQIVLGMRLEIDPIADFGHVYRGAIDWVLRGSYAVEPERADYFCLYPNNLGLTALLAALFFVVKALGSESFYLAAVVLASLTATVTVLVCADILRRMAGRALALTGAAAFVLLPSYLLVGAVFYSDTMTLLFPPLLLWLSLVARERQPRRRWPIDLLIALCAFAGYLLKATVLIMLIALWIGALLRYDWKRTSWKRLCWKRLAAQVIATVCVFAVGSVGWNAVIVNRYLNRETLAYNKVPLVSWLVLGANMERGHNAFEDVFRSGTSGPERAAAGWEMLRTSLQAKAEKGKLPAYYARKLSIALGGGTLGLADFLDDRPQNKAVLHQVVLIDAPHYNAYNAWCSGLLFGLFLLAMFAALQGLRGKNPLAMGYPEVYVALVGVFLFLMAWELRERYFSNYVPVVILAAVMGLCPRQPGPEPSDPPPPSSEGS